MMHAGIALIVAALTFPGGDFVRGTVRGPEGNPVDNADVWLLNGSIGLNGLPETHVVSTADGRFAIPVPKEAPFGHNFQLNVVVIKSGLGLATVRIDARFLPVPVLQLKLEPSVPVTLKISDPQGRSLAGAKAQLRSLASDAHGGGMVFLPTSDSEHFARRTNQRGEITLDLPRSLRSYSLSVEAPEWGTQDIYGSGDVADRSVRLQPVGKLRGRLTGAGPKSTADALVRILSIPSQPTPSQPATSQVGVLGQIDVRTDERGFFEVPALVGGQLRVWWVQRAAGSPIFLEKEVSSLLMAGESREIEVPVVRGSRVYGKVIDGETARPLSRIRVHVSLNQSRGGIASSWSVSTDDEGKYEAYVPPVAGQVNVQFGPLPAPYWRASGSGTGELRGEFPQADEDLEMPDFLLRPGVQLQGTVVDARKRPVSLARVQAATIDPASGVYQRVIAETDSDGKFSLGPVNDKSVLALMANDETRGSPEVFILDPDAPRKSIVLPIDKSAMVSFSSWRTRTSPLGRSRRSAAPQPRWAATLPS